MEYYAAVTMLKQMIENGILDEEDYIALEAIYAKKYKAQIRFPKPGLIGVDAVKTGRKGA